MTILIAIHIQMCETSYERQFSQPCTTIIVIIIQILYINVDQQERNIQVFADVRQIYVLQNIGSGPHDPVGIASLTLGIYNRCLSDIFCVIID